MAKGISEALLLTFEGVGLSVPAIYFFSFFRNRVLQIVGDDDDSGGRVPAALRPGRPRQAGRPRPPAAAAPKRKEVIAMSGSILAEPRSSPT